MCDQLASIPTFQKYLVYHCLFSMTGLETRVNLVVFWTKEWPLLMQTVIIIIIFYSKAFEYYGYFFFKVVTNTLNEEVTDEKPSNKLLVWEALKMEKTTCRSNVDFTLAFYACT